MIHNKMYMKIPVGEVVVEGTLTLPPDTKGVVFFAHGRGRLAVKRKNRWIYFVCLLGWWRW
jgi:hypothetical protein